jgi:hypothetical protein
MSDADWPVIVATTLGPGHDGRAELVVELEFANGGRTLLSVTQEAIERALDAAGLTSLDELTGRPWTVLTTDRAGSDAATTKGAPCST